MKDITKKFLTSRNRQYKNVFESEEGKLVLAELYKFCGLNRPSYVEGNPDRTAYNEGLKRVAYHIRSILKQSDKDIDKLLEDYSNHNNFSPYNI